LSQPLPLLLSVAFSHCEKVYLALAILPDGSRDVLGIWIEHTEGAKFCLKVFNDLKNRGVGDILIAEFEAGPGSA